MKKATLKLNTLALLFILPLSVLSQTKNPPALSDSLCQKWTLDSLELKYTGKKFAAPQNIKHNFLDFQRNGTFTGQDAGIDLKGKWKSDPEKRQLLQYEIDHPLLKEGMVFTLLELTDSTLSITSKAMSGSQVIMHYKLAGKK